MTNTAPMPGQVFARVWNLEDYAARDPETDEVVEFKGSIDEANVTTSKVLGKTTHKLIIDLDLPTQLLPSTTKDHYHLYVDHEIPEIKYFALLTALKDAGLIEDGYHGASLNRGYTAVRLPWIKKPVEVAEPF